MQNRIFASADSPPCTEASSSGKGGDAYWLPIVATILCPMRILYNAALGSTRSARFTVSY